MNKKMVLSLCFALGSTAIYAQSADSTAAIAEPSLAGTLSLFNGKTMVTNDQLNAKTVIIEDVTRHYVKEAVVADNEQGETLIDLTNLPKGIYYVKGIHDNIKVLYKVVKP
jgi:hypothetical protein